MDCDTFKTNLDHSIVTILIAQFESKITDVLKCKERLNLKFKRTHSLMINPFLCDFRKTTCIQYLCSTWFLQDGISILG